MDQFNFLERNTFETTTEIVNEIERLEAEDFGNTTVTGDSLFFSHSKCDSLYLDEMLLKLGPEFPTVELNAGPVIQAPSNRFTLADLKSMASNFVEENCEQIIPTRNDCVIQESTTTLGGDVATMLHHLKQQQEMILKNYLDLQNQVNRQQEIILDLQLSNLDLNNQVKKQQQFNTITETRLLTFQALIDERLNSQNTQIDQGLTTSELTDLAQLDIAENDDVVVTNERSSLTDCCQIEQLQDVQRVQSSAEDVERMEDETSLDTELDDELEEIVQSENVTPSYQGENLNQSQGSLKIRSVWSGDGDGKRTLFSLESMEEYPQRVQKSQAKIYSCAECKKQFKGKSELTRHFRIHTGEKPFKCKDCGYAFSQLGNLRSHQKIHFEERPTFICGICRKSFRHERSLSKHMAVHVVGQTSRQCNVCKREFRYKASWIKHLQLHPQRRH